MAINHTPNKIKKYAYAYFIGIGGVGMSALARWFYQQKIIVFGYDRATTALTTLLIQEGIQIHFEDRVAAIPNEILQHKDKSLVVYTSAIPKHQAILSYLYANNYAIYKRGEILGMITQQYFTIAIAGTHGKTTTSSLMAHVLYSAGKNVTAFLGGIAKNYGSNLVMQERADQDKIIVIEADEFDRFFLQLHPDVAIVTTVDPDHLDTYGDAKQFELGFYDFIHRVPKEGKIIAQQAATKKLGAHGYVPQIAHYALSGAPIQATNIHISNGLFYFDYVSKNVTIKDIQLSIPGYHHVENALGVITACLYIGLSPTTIHQGFHTFQGVRRRFELIIQREELVFIDDYGHHPVEVAALLKTIRALYPNKKITVVFRPNLYTRTKDFANEFARSLSLANQVFLLDIYPDREQLLEGVTSALIFDQMLLKDKYLCTQQDLVAQLTMHAKPEVIVSLGSGGTSQIVRTIKNFLLKNWE